MTGSRCVLLGSIMCGLSVAFGAFAAHGLDRFFVEKYSGQTREVGGLTMPLAAKFLNDFKTAAEYQMYHGLALVATGLVAERNPSRSARLAGGAFTLGIVLFSGSLYILTLTGITKWGMITPLGGIAFLVGWLLLAFAACSKPRLV